MRGGLSSAEVAKWAVALGAHSGVALEADQSPARAVADTGISTEPATHAPAAGLPPARVHAHCAALNPPLSRRTLQRAIAQGLVEHPKTRGRGRGKERLVEYPPAVLAQLDGLAAARGETRNPAKIRLRIWWRGGPVGAPPAVRGALYRRVREDWDAALRSMQPWPELRGVPAESPELLAMEEAAGRVRGLRRASGIRPPRVAGTWLWAQTSAAVAAGRHGLLVTSGGAATPIGKALVETVGRSLVAAAVISGGLEAGDFVARASASPRAVATFAGAIGREMDRWTRAPIGEMPEADAEAARTRLREAREQIARVNAEADRLAVARPPLPNLDRLGVGREPLVTALFVVAAFGAEWLRQAWCAEQQASA